VKTGTLGNLGEGEHTMTFYYLERGSSQSNCAIYFNLAPRYGMEIKKEDVLTQQLLNGAEFSVFMDKACTKQITNSTQLEIRALAHTASVWEKTQSEHFKVCAVCGSEIENVRGAHSDKNEDKACDTCGYMMDGSATEETEATDTTETTDQTTTGETGTQTDPTEGNKQENGSNEAPPANEPEKQNKKSDKSYILLIVAGVCGAGAAFVYFGWPKLWPKLKKYFKK
jgi:hypothetical protein